MIRDNQASKTAAGVAPAFDRAWHDWLVAQLLDRRPGPELAKIMVARGFDPNDAKTTIDELAASPVLQAAVRAHRPSHKLAGLARSLGTMFVRSGFRLERRRLTGQEFYEGYFFTNRPVVLTGLMDDWPALRTWSPEHFKARYGSVMVEITESRESDPRYERNFADHRATVSFGSYVDGLLAGDAGNDRYLVARNHVLDLPGLAPLKEDFSCPDGFLDPNTRRRPYVRLWFGPAGTLTPLHCDDRNILFAQVTGRKHVRLVPPYFYLALYNTESCYSEVDLDDVDLDAFPKMRDVPVLETVLEPGEFLFLPLGWWHWVKSLEVSTSLTFTNFYEDDPPAVWRELML